MCSTVVVRLSGGNIGRKNYDALLRRKLQPQSRLLTVLLRSRSDVRPELTQNTDQSSRTGRNLIMYRRSSTAGPHHHPGRVRMRLQEGRPHKVVVGDHR